MFSNKQTKTFIIHTGEPQNAFLNKKEQNNKQ